MKKIEKKEGKTAVYEIGYLLISSLPAEKVEGETTSLREILIKNGGEMIGEELPELRPLSYTMVKKIGASNHSFDKGYFGWFKFELGTADIESVKKAFEANPHMLRLLVIDTVRENTYLGRKSGAPAPEVFPESAVPTVVSIEEMDKSIDAMVKEA